ncbi:MAG: Asparagine synthetase [Solirubrobacterales bacterium]|nr:Asparagine synthetase [Solirubrobacterales bacterium]
MTDAIAHRGPDEDGFHREPGVALGMRRLSVIDVAGSHQPIRSEDGTVHAVFNGEIYNFAALRAGLRARGHRLATDGDGETIVHLYEEYGPGFVHRLRGMFAIALWDRARRRLVLVRDRMGVKPLYYTITPDGLAFGSEVKSLIAGGLVHPELDPIAAELFLAHGFVPGPRTLFAGVHKLPAASLLVWEDGRASGPRSYWTAWDGTDTGAGSGWEADQERLLELLRTAVHDRMVSDVPLGVMLSGGLDSSLITALMTERSSGPVKTFSIAFAEDAGSNELADARAVARRLGTDHHELMTSAVDHPALLDRVLWHQEEPVADVSGLGFLLLSELARESVTVALSGQGADELLGGYRKHEIAALATAARRGVPRTVRRACAAAARSSPSHGPFARGVLAVTTDDPVERLLAMSRVVQPRERLQLLHPAFRRPQDEAEAAIAGVVAAQLPITPCSPLAETLHLDSRLALVDNMLLYFDKLSMATSLEVRVPFMDHDVVAFCTALPDSHRVWRLRRKELLKRASRGLVADAIIDKPKRGFFHSALGAWLEANRATFVTETLLDGRVQARGQYQADAVAQLVQHAALDDKKAAQRLFSLVLLERWQRLFVDGETVAGVTRPAPIARAA